MTRCSIERLCRAACCLLLLGAGAPQARFDAGLEAYRARRYQEAMGIFLEVLAEDPRHQAALTYQTAALQGWVTERSVEARRESLAMMRLSLRPGETEEVAFNMCREALARVEAADPLAASDFIHRALELRGDHPEVRRTLERVQEAVRGRLDLQRVRGSVPDGPAMLPGLEGLERLNAGDSRAALPLLEQALALSDPGDTLDPYLQRFLRLARAGKDVTQMREESAPKTEPALPLAPSREREGVEAAAPAKAPTRLYGPPTPVPSPFFPSREREGTEGRAFDGAGSEAAYLRGVTAYMADRLAEARAELREAVRLNPDNRRAMKMLKRLEKEAVSP